MMQLQRTIGNKATISLVQSRQSSLQRKPQNVIQRDDDDENESLLNQEEQNEQDEQANHQGQYEEPDIFPDADPNEPAKEASEEEMDVIKRGGDVANVVDLFSGVITAATALEQNLAAYMDKKADIDLSGELQSIADMIVAKVGRKDVGSLADLVAMLRNPFNVTAKAVYAAERALESARQRVVKLSSKSGKIEDKIKRKGMKDNVKKNQSELDPQGELLSKIGGTFTDVTASIVGSIVGVVSSVVLTPFGGAAVGWGTKKLLQTGAKKGVETLYEDQFVKKEMKKDNVEQAEPMLGISDKKKGRIGKALSSAKGQLDYYASEDGMKKEGKKMGAKELLSQGLEVAADFASVADGGISGAVVSGVMGFGASKAVDQMYGSQEIEKNHVAYQLNFSDVASLGQTLDDFMKAVERLFNAPQESESEDEV